uniref:Bradykinin receptor B2 n=1 Tax=Cyprinodon variegatus TaxID=28743 RepID=A0A3Q2EC09_CYPVA
DVITENQGLPANSTFMHRDPNQTSSCSYEDDFSRGEVYVMISILGIILNSFVLIVLCLHKKPCSVPEIYLSNLAAADLVLMFCILLWAVLIFRDYDWDFGSFMCKVYRQTYRINYTCSVYLLVMVSIDRYLAVVHPLSCMNIREPLYAKLGCALVWSLGFFQNISYFIYSETKTVKNNITTCSFSFPVDTMLRVRLMSVVLTFIIPIIIISFCTVMILKTLRRRLSNSLQQTDHKATTLVLACLLAFLICWGPYQLMEILRWLHGVKVLTGCRILTVIRVCLDIFFYLGLLNSIINPVLYIIVGNNFRMKIRELCKGREEESTSGFNEMTESIAGQHRDKQDKQPYSYLRGL